MASLSNINGLFDVHSTGAILFSTSHGTSGQILRSNGNAAPTWVAASTVIGGPYLPLTGGTLTGATATATGISFTVGGALTVGGNNVVGFSGSWNGANMPGSRWNGYSVNGGEIVFKRDNPNSGQMSILVDGGYYAGENNGFYSLYSANSYNSKAGFYADTSGVLQFNAPATFTGLVSGITPTANANFATKAYVDGVTPGAGPFLKLDGTTTMTGSILQVTSESVIGSFKGTTASGYAEFHIRNDVDHSLVMGSIGSTYTSADWAGSTYIYNGGSKKMYIKSQNELRLLTGGTSLSSNTALIIDTSQNSTFLGKIGIGITTPQAPLSFDNIVGDKIDFYHNVTGSDRYGVEVQSSELRIFSGAQGASTGGITFGKKTTSTFTEAMRIRNDGNVGIGTTSPDAKLDIHSSGSWGAYGRGSSGDINVENTNTSVNEGGWIGIAGYTGNAANNGFYPMAGITAKKSTASGDGNYGGDLSFWTTAGTGQSPEANSGIYQRMTINRSGKVGIGTTSPSNKLEVFAPGNGDGILIQSDSAGVNRAPALHLNPIAASANERNWAIAPFRDVPQSLSFSSSNAKGGNAYAVATTRMIIDGISGNVGIGVTGPGHKLEVNGGIRAGIAGGSSGNIPGLKVYAASASTDTTAAIAIQQGTSEGDTIIFADYEPHVEWGISAQNSTDQIHFTAGSSTNNLGSKTFYNNAGAARTAYIKFNHDLTDGTTLIGGQIGMGRDYNGGIYAINTSSTPGIDSNWGLEVQRTANVDDYNTRLKYYPVSGQSRKAGIFDSRNNRFSLYSDTNNNPDILIPHAFLGIGNTSPTYRLQLGTSGDLASSIRLGTYAVAKNTRQYIGYTRADSGLFEESGNGNTPSTVLAGVAGIRIVNTTGTLSSGAADNSVQLLTHIYNGGSRVALHASYNGNVGINNTSPDAYLRVDGTTSVTAARFYGTGGTRPPLELRQNNTAGWFAKFYSDNFGTYIGGISFYGSSTTFNTSSDYRLKENIIPISDSITRLKQLKPSRFNFKQYPEITIDGFLAHEVQKIVPEAVTGDKDELDSDGKPVYQAIDHSRLIPLLVAAIQELEARVKELENK